MIVPFGNPQNLYLYSYYGLDLGDFLAAMALPFALSTAGIVACTWWLCGQSNGSCGRDDTRSLAVPMPLSRRRLAIYGALVALTLLAVFRIVPVAAAVAVVAAALAALDRRALAAVDWGLLATFACFFVFAGNLARIPAVEGFFSFWMGESALLVAAGASQIISNVPAAVLLSHFADGYQALLVGVNIGGAGTLVASLASLITFNEYRLVRRGFPSRPALARVTPGAYLARFTAYNAAFLVVLLLVCAPFV